MATADKLNYLLETKNQIKNAIVGKGVGVEDTDSFRSYATKIGQIEGGGTEDLSAFIAETNTSFGYIFQKIFKKMPDTFWEFIDTSNTTNLQNMFREAVNLVEINLSNLNMNNVTNVTNMFYNCVNLINVERNIRF